jgi:hypothetical protein
LLIAALMLSSRGVVTAQRVAEKALFDQWANAIEPLPGPAAPIGFYGAATAA